MTGSPQPKRLKRSSSGIHEADGSTSSSSSASANQPASSGACDLHDNTSSSASASSASSPCLSLSSFWDLPEELKFSIITLACSLPSPLFAGTSTGIDAATARSLSLASRSFHVQANATLWRDIRLTRPSALKMLHQAVSNRPELGLRIKSLHVGPEEEGPASREPHRWQQVDGGLEFLRISTSLRTTEEAQRLPRWCTPGQEWRVDSPVTDCCRATAVFKALQEVQRSLDIDLGSRRQVVVRNRTLPRLYEAQTALDLYLMEMRRIEDEEVCTVSRQRGCKHDGNCSRYPPLIIIGTATQPDMPQWEFDDAGEPYVLTRQQLVDHLDRPGSAQDKFDHPLLLARSHFNPRALNAPGVKPIRWKPDYQYDGHNVVESASSAAPEPRVLTQGGPQVQATAVLPVLKVLHKLLHLTPRLENLSLAGVFDFRGWPWGKSEDAPPPPGRQPILPGLKSYSVGPPPRFRHWTENMFNSKELKNIEAMHICGFLPSGESVAKLGSLKRLKNVRWTLTDGLHADEVFKLGVMLDALTGRKGAAVDAAAARASEGARHNNLQPAILKKLRAQKPRQGGQRNKSQSATPQDEDGEPARIDNNSLPLIEVRLRPEALLTMLQRAASSEERTAWTTGTLWPGCNQTRRLLLTEVPAVRSFTSEGKPQHPLFEAAREWWEEHRAI